jgi:membrane protease YdiL (CAAX protease family)
VTGDAVDCTIRTTRPTDIYTIDLDNGDERALEALRGEVTASVGRSLARRLDDSNVSMVETLDRQLGEARRQRAAAGYVILTMSILALYALGLRLLLDLDLKGWSRGVSSVILVILYLVPLIVILRSGPFTAADLGITLRGAPRNIRRCVYASLVFLGALIGVKLLAIAVIPKFAENDLFELATVFVRYLPDGAIDWQFYGLNIGIYMLFVPVQELITRCGLQTLLFEFLYGDERMRAVVAILTSNLIFAAVHAHLNVGLAVATFCGGLFWGWLFYRYRTVVGVSISHAIIGAAALFALGLERLLT